MSSHQLHFSVKLNPLSLTTSPTKILPLLPTLCRTVIRRPTNRGRFIRRNLSKLIVFSYRGLRVSTIGALFRLLCFEFLLFGGVNGLIYCTT